MCGILAVLRTGDVPISRRQLDAMVDVVEHRGPDGRGVESFRWRAGALAATRDDDWRVALGHRRLSILDLSSAGRQPMRGPDGTWISYNGEVYNYVELRKELEGLGHAFHTETDTEVVLAAFAAWGTECFARFRGMWALVLLDPRQGRLLVSRDRLGIKPLYIARTARCVAIGSEPKQVRLLPGIDWRPDALTLTGYLVSGWERGGASFFDGVAPLPAGTWMEVSLDDGTASEPISYWHPETIAPRQREPRAAAEELRACFLDAIRIHLRSEVPVGTALSGGLDSSAVAVGVRAVSQDAERFHAFSAVFPGHAIDESTYIGDAARAAGAIEHTVAPAAQGFLSDLDRFLWHHDEPVGSASQYAGYAVARLTREHGVPVSLNGQGGDEVLAGYWQAYFSHLFGLATRGRILTLGREVAGSLLPGGNHEAPWQLPPMVRRYLSRWRGGSGLELKNRRALPADAPTRTALRMSSQARRLWLIREFTLPRLLKWDDRNFMAFSVEGRYPFLDHVVIETCLSFDDTLLYGSGWTKTPLRRALHDLLPQSIATRRTKVAFETPQSTWLRQGLRELVDEVVAADSPVWDYVEPASARRLASRLARSMAPRAEDGQALMRLLFADRWMRQHFA